MSRLDKFEEILKSYEGRELEKRFLFLLDQDCHEDFYKSMIKGVMSSLPEVAGHVPAYGIIKYMLLPHFDGSINSSLTWSDLYWHDGKASSDEMFLRQFLDSQEISSGVLVADCLKKAISKGETTVLSVSNNLLSQDLVSILKGHSDSRNQVCMIEVSGIWPAGYDGHGFGIHRKTGSHRTLPDLIQGYVELLLTGEQEP